MKIKIITEIGLNHLGNKNYLKEYLEVLCKKDVDGITIQIPKKSLMQKSQKKFLFKDEIIKRFIINAKKKFPLVGITTSDQTKIDFFSKLKIDFFKVTSGMIKNHELINKMKKSKVKEIYLSTGFSTLKEIKLILKRIDKNKIILLYTCFENGRKKTNLKKISTFKNKFKLPVAFGNHSSSLETITKSAYCKPTSIFFYVKLNKKLNYPDDNYAVKVNNIDNIIRKIRQIQLL